MKIPSDNEHLIKLVRTKMDRTTTAKPKSTSGKKASAPSVQISPEAMEMKNISEATRNAPDARMDKVSELKTTIEKGNYSVDIDKLADILSKYM